MKKLKEIFRNIFTNENLGELDSEQYSIRVLYWGGLFFAFVSLILTAFNIAMGYWLMATSTAILAVGFGVACLCARAKHFEASRILMALVCMITFSMYAATGQNYGFAILWIILIPIVSMLLLGLRIGFVISLYFQIFLIVLLWTPAANYVSDYYSTTFTMRFPALYFASFGIVTFLMYERQKLYTRSHELAISDALTGLNNRHRSTEVADELEDCEKHPTLAVVSIDVNRLKWANDNLGHQAGDELIKATADLMREVFPDDYCFRMGGDEFEIITERIDFAADIATLRERVAAWHGTYVDALTLSIGSASRVDHPDMSYRDLSKLADKQMYEDKRIFYESGKFDRRTR